MRNIILALVAGAAVLVAMPAAAATASAGPPTPTVTPAADHQPAANHQPVLTPARPDGNHQPALRPHTTSVGCTFDACTNQDPFAMGCNTDEVNLDVDLYYSPSCQAAWAQLSDNPNEAQVPAAVIWYVAPGGGAEQDLSGTAGVSTGAVFTSPMVSWNDSVKGCWTLDYGTGITISNPAPEGAASDTVSQSWACSDWY